MLASRLFFWDDWSGTPSPAPAPVPAPPASHSNSGGGNHKRNDEYRSPDEDYWDLRGKAIARNKPSPAPTPAPLAPTPAPLAPPTKLSKAALEVLELAHEDLRQRGDSRAQQLLLDISKKRGQ